MPIAEAWFGGEEHDPRTGEYYLHLFDRSQPDLNWRNPEVRKAMYAAMQFWLDRGVDGLRLDAAQQMFDASPDNIQAAITRAVRQFEAFRILDQNALFGAFAHAHHNGCGSGQPQRTRAGNDQQHQRLVDRIEPCRAEDQRWY